MKNKNILLSVAVILLAASVVIHSIESMILTQMIRSVNKRAATVEQRIEELDKQLGIMQEMDASITDAVQKNSESIEQMQTKEQIREEKTTEDNVVEIEEVRWVYEDNTNTTSIEVYSGDYIYVGEFELTAYEWTGNPCSNGNYPTFGYTVASNYFPLGTTLYIDGYGTYVVEDRGGMADNVVDIYMGDYDTCIQFGRQIGSVYIVE